MPLGYTQLEEQAKIQAEGQVPPSNGDEQPEEGSPRSPEPQGDAESAPGGDETPDEA